MNIIVFVNNVKVAIVDVIFIVLFDVNDDLFVYVVSAIAVIIVVGVVVVVFKFFLKLFYYFVDVVFAKFDLNIFIKIVFVANFIVIVYVVNIIVLFCLFLCVCLLMNIRRNST